MPDTEACCVQTGRVVHAEMVWWELCLVADKQGFVVVDMQGGRCARSTAARMAAAATVMGDAAEARFWHGLPATLAALRARLPVRAAYPHPNPDLAAGVAAAFGGAASRSGSGTGLGPRACSADSQGTDPGSNPGTRAPAARGCGEAPFAARAHIPGDPRRAALPVAPTAARKGSGGGEGALEAAAAGTGVLWGEAVELAEARERVAWHEAMGRGSGPSAEHLQARACTCCEAVESRRCMRKLFILLKLAFGSGISLHSHFRQPAPSDVSLRCCEKGSCLCGALRSGRCLLWHTCYEMHAVHAALLLSLGKCVPNTSSRARRSCE